MKTITTISLLFLIFYLIGCILSYIIIRSEYYDIEKSENMFNKNYKLKFNNELEFIKHIISNLEIIIIAFSWWTVLCYWAIIYIDRRQVIKFNFKPWKKIKE